MTDDTVAPATYRTFEYFYAELSTSIAKSEVVDELNKFGAEGWQVVGFVVSGGFRQFLLTREVL